MTFHSKTLADLRESEYISCRGNLEAMADTTTAPQTKKYLTIGRNSSGIAASGSRPLHDSNTYHKTAIGALKNGWNPVYENIEDVVK